MFIGRIIISSLKNTSKAAAFKREKKQKTKKRKCLPSCVVGTCSRRLHLWKSPLAAAERLQKRFYRITIEEYPATFN